VNTRVTQSMTTRVVLSDIQNVAERLARTQQKIASGKELSAPSDDPYRASRALQLRSELSEHQQYTRNVGEARSWQNATDTALGAINNFVLRARDLVVRASSGTLGQTDRDAIAKEIDQLAAAVKAEGNTKYAGRYVFSGTSTNTAPYVDTDDLYHGAVSPSDVRREIGPGVQVAVNIVGSDVIGDGTTGILGALRRISADLAAGNTAALQTTDLQSIDNAHSQLVNQRAVVGALSNRLEAAQGRLGELEEATTKLLSETEDADMAKTLIDFSTQQSVYQAALQSGARLIQPSLLDFLQ
jgi:flagellar hook-associated protein 3 FlgL